MPHKIFDNNSIICRQLFESTTSTFTYIIGDIKSKEAILIDSVKESVERDYIILEKLGLTLKYGITTHIHAAHSSGFDLLKQKLQFMTIVSSDSLAKADLYLDDEKTVEFGDFSLVFRSIPGHTNGSMACVLHDTKMIFTGDALLIGGCGKTDFEQGNSAALYDAVHQKIFSLPDDYWIYPAHDYAGHSVSHVGKEKRENKHFSKTKDEFVHIMKTLSSDNKNQQLDNKLTQSNETTLVDLYNDKQAEKKNTDADIVEVKPVTKVFTIIGKVCASIILGFIFGWAMEKAKVYEPLTIKQQMIFTKFIMLKMFFAAMGTSTLAILILSLAFKKIYNEVFNSYCDGLKNKSAFIIAFGAFILGMGMEISGACPGMVLVQLGAGVPWSYLTYIGAIVGALLHGLLNSYIMKGVKTDLIVSKSIGQILCNINDAIPRSVMVVLLGVSVFLLEYFIPWTDEYPNAIVEGSSNVMLYKAWPPALCGVILGSLQFFTILILRRSLGTSSSYSTLAGIPFITKKMQEKFPYLAKFRTGFPNWLTVIFVCSAILGGFGSSYSSGVWGKSVSIHPYNAFFGGLFMVFGARVAGGCTSGHGISGTSHEFLGSLLAVMCMFAGGIFIGFYAYFGA